LAKVENIVNDKIRKNIALRKRNVPIGEATKWVHRHIGEKYGDFARLSLSTLTFG
jgi:alanyl-tRNA synthetase